MGMGVVSSLGLLQRKAAHSFLVRFRTEDGRCFAGEMGDDGLIEQ
jgi:hypothetical protein